MFSVSSFSSERIILLSLICVVHVCYKLLFFYLFIFIFLRDFIFKKINNCWFYPLFFLSVLQFVFPGKIQSVSLKSVKSSSSKLVAAVVPDLESVDMSSWGQEVIEPRGQPVKRAPELDSVGLALAAAMIKSKKARREFELSGWNRWDCFSGKMGFGNDQINE